MPTALLIAIYAAYSASKNARESKAIAKEQIALQTRPFLTTDVPPTIEVQQSGEEAVTFVLCNEGKGHARIVSYRVTDALDAPTQQIDCQVVPEDSNPVMTKWVIAPEATRPFVVDVPGSAHWFRERIRNGEAWAFDAVYTDMNGGQRTQSCFGVASVDGHGWQLTEPVHLV